MYEEKLVNVFQGGFIPIKVAHWALGYPQASAFWGPQSIRTRVLWSRQTAVVVESMCVRDFL